MKKELTFRLGDRFILSLFLFKSIAYRQVYKPTLTGILFGSTISGDVFCSYEVYSPQVDLLIYVSKSNIIRQIKLINYTDEKKYKVKKIPNYKIGYEKFGIVQEVTIPICC